MKNTKINLLLMTVLLAVQSIAHADNEDKPEPRTWRQAAWDNRYNIAASSAAVGLATLGYLYGQNFITWFNQLSPAEQTNLLQNTQESINNDLQNIEQSEDELAEQITQLEDMNSAKKHNAAQQNKVAEQEAAIIEKEETISQARQDVAKKQSWLQLITNRYFDMRANDPDLKRIQDEINANNAAYQKNEPLADDRSDADRAEYLKNVKSSIKDLNKRQIDNPGYINQMSNLAYYGLTGQYGKANNQIDKLQQKFSGTDLSNADTESVQSTSEQAENNEPDLATEGNNNSRPIIIQYNPELRDQLQEAYDAAHTTMALSLFGLAQELAPDEDQSFNTQSPASLSSDEDDQEPAITDGYFSNFMNNYNPFSAQPDTTVYNPSISQDNTKNSSSEQTTGNTPIDNASEAPSANINRLVSTSPVNDDDDKDFWVTEGNRQSVPMTDLRASNTEGNLLAQVNNLEQAPNTVVTSDAGQEPVVATSSEPSQATNAPVVETRESELARKAKNRKALSARLENTMKKSEEYLAKNSSNKNTSTSSASDQN